MLADIHPLGQDPDNQDAALRDSVEDDVALVGGAPVAGPNVLRGRAHARMLAQQFQTGLQGLVVFCA